MQARTVRYYGVEQMVALINWFDSKVFKPDLKGWIDLSLSPTWYLP